MKPAPQKANSSSQINKVNPTIKISQQVLPTQQTSNKAQQQSISINQTQSNALPQYQNNTNNISQLNPIKKQVKEEIKNVGSKQISSSSSSQNEIKVKVKVQNAGKQMIQKIEVKQDQHIEETKEDLLIKIDSSNSQQFVQKTQQLNPSVSKFFEKVNDELVLKIASYLPITDLITFACISKKARKLVSIVMQANNDVFYNIIQFQSLNSSNEFLIVYSLHRLKGSYAEINSSLPALEKTLQNFQQQKVPFQDVILEILAVGVSYSSNITKTKSNILDHIKEKGIINSFSGLNLNYVTPIKTKTFLPQCPDIRNNELGKFVKIIHNYVEYKQSNKLSIEKQKLLYQQVQLNNLRQKYINTTKKVLSLFSKPLLIMSNGNSIFDFANKNTISIIIKFLKFQEIVQLMRSGKQMKVLIHEIIQDQLIQMKSIRESKMREINFNSEIATAIIYTKHLNLFHEENHYKLLVLYNSETFLNMYLALNKVTSASFVIQDEEDENADLSKKQIDLYNLNFCIPSADKIRIFNNLISTFPTLISFKEKLIKEKQNQQITRDCILLYYGMLGLIRFVKLNYNNESWKKADDNYNKYLFTLDARIFYFEKFLGKNEEVFFIFLKKRIKRSSIAKNGIKPVTVQKLIN